MKAFGKQSYGISKPTGSSCRRAATRGRNDSSRRLVSAPATGRTTPPGSASCPARPRDAASTAGSELARCGRIFVRRSRGRHPPPAYPLCSTSPDRAMSCRRLVPMLGNTNGCRRRSSVRAASRRSSARRVSVTRCSRFIFIRSAGMVHTWPSMSISPTSPAAPRPTAPPSTRNSNARLTAGCSDFEPCGRPRPAGATGAVVRIVANWRGERLDPDWVIHQLRRPRTLAETTCKRRPADQS